MIMSIKMCITVLVNQIQLSRMLGNNFTFNYYYLLTLPLLTNVEICKNINKHNSL